MSGTVQHVRVSPDRLHGSLAIAHYRQGRLLVRVHERELAPRAVDALDGTAERLISQYDLHLHPADVPAIRYHVSRVNAIPGGRLVAAQVVDAIAYVEVLRTLISEDLAAALSAIGTNFARYLRNPGEDPHAVHSQA